MRALRWQLLLLSVLALCALIVPARADDVADAIDASRVKVKAGKAEEALADLDGLLLTHGRDPRVHYQRATVLKELKQLNDAADALEAAQAAMEAYEKDGGADEAVLAIKPGLTSDAAAMLKFRTQGRKALADYRVKALEIAGALLGESRPLEAAYVLDELAAAVAPDEEFDELLQAVRQVLRSPEPAPEEPAPEEPVPEEPAPKEDG